MPALKAVGRFHFLLKHLRRIVFRRTIGVRYANGKTYRRRTQCAAVQRVCHTIRAEISDKRRLSRPKREGARLGDGEQGQVEYFHRKEDRHESRQEVDAPAGTRKTPDGTRPQDARNRRTLGLESAWRPFQRGQRPFARHEAQALLIQCSANYRLSVTRSALRLRPAS